MGWDMDIVNQTNDYLIDADYWSRLDSNLCYDPSFCKYLHLISNLHKAHPPPTSLPLKAEHMPYYRGPCIPVEHCLAGTSTDDSEDTIADNVATTLIASIITQGNTGQTSLCVHPVRFGLFLPITQLEPVRALYNSEFPALAYQAMNFSWAVYGFNSGHFLLTISKWNLSFSVVLACNPFEYSRALFHKFSACPTVLPSTGALLDHIRASGKQVPLDGYLIHSHCYQTNEPATVFWGVQASIAIQLKLIWKLNLFIAFVHPDHNGRSIFKFVKQLASSGWVLSHTTCLFPDFGDSVIGKALIIVGVHDSTKARTERIPP